MPIRFAPVEREWSRCAAPPGPSPDFSVVGSPGTVAAQQRHQLALGHAQVDAMQHVLLTVEACRSVMRSISLPVGTGFRHPPPEGRHHAHASTPHRLPARAGPGTPRCKALGQHLPALQHGDAVAWFFHHRQVVLPPWPPLSLAATRLMKSRPLDPRPRGHACVGSSSSISFGSSASVVVIPARLRP